MWQDFVFTLGSICFNIALLPMLRRDAPRPPLITSETTSLFLFSFVIAYASLGLWFAAISTLIGSILWSVIGILKRINY